MRTTRRLGLPLLLAAALLAAGCGGSGSGDDAAGPTGTDADGQPVAAELPPCPVDALAAADGPVEVPLRQAA